MELILSFSSFKIIFTTETKKNLFSKVLARTIIDKFLLHNMSVKSINYIVVIPTKFCVNWRISLRVYKNIGEVSFFSMLTMAHFLNVYFSLK